MYQLNVVILYMLFSGSCSLPSNLVGVPELPIISDSECSTRWGASFNADLMICVFNGQQGACNVSLYP